VCENFCCAYICSFLTFLSMVVDCRRRSCSSKFMASCLSALSMLVNLSLQFSHYFHLSQSLTVFTISVSLSVTSVLFVFRLNLSQKHNLCSIVKIMIDADVVLKTYLYPHSRIAVFCDLHLTLLSSVHLTHEGSDVTFPLCCFSMFCFLSVVLQNG